MTKRRLTAGGRSAGSLCGALILVATSAVPVAAIDPAKPLRALSLDRWRNENGLPQGSITSFLKARDGYLWLGTQEGLVRFDGTQFKVFDRTVSPAFQSNHIQTLLEGPEGGLWIGTVGGGLLHYDGRVFRSFGPEHGLQADTVNALASDRHGGIWVGTSRAGLAHLEGDRITTVLGPRDGLPSDAVSALLVRSDGTVWVGTSAGLARVESGRVEVSGAVPRGQAVTALVEGVAGSLWIGTASGLIQWEAGRVRIHQVGAGLGHDQIQALAMDAHQTLWVGTFSGLSRWRGGSFENLTRGEGLPEELILALFADGDGSLWIGTDGGGLARLREPRVVSFTVRDGLSSDNVYTVAGRRAGGLWIGCAAGGVDRSDQGRFRPVLSSKMTSSRVRALFEDTRARLWIGTDRGLLLLSADGRLSTYDADHGLPHPTVRAITEDPDGALWFGTDGGGIARYDGRGFITYGVAHGLAGSEVRTILVGMGGELWIGTYGGLSCFRNGRFTNYSVEQGLSHNLVRCLHQSHDGTLWVGTYGGGLNRFFRGRIQSITTRHGLLSDAIFSILEDDRGYLWMSCNRGIFRIAKSELDAVAEGQTTRIRSLSLDESDGMLSRECNGGNPAAWRGADGRLYFATVKGVVVVDPDRLGQGAPPPPVIIEEVVLDGAPQLAKPGERVPPHPHRIEFRFAALSFTAPHKVLFSYRLEGFDRAWTEAGPLRAASYTEIPPGHYRFVARASDREGIWADTEARLDLEVQAAFYQTRLFRLLAATGLLGVAIGIYRLRTRQLRERQQELTQKVEEAVARIKMLRGLLPICSNCKRVRDDKGYWSQLEDYIEQHSEADFSHSLCNECVRELYPEIGAPPPRRSTRK